MPQQLPKIKKNSVFFLLLSWKLSLQLTDTEWNVKQGRQIAYNITKSGLVWQ